MLLELSELVFDHLQDSFSVLGSSPLVGSRKLDPEPGAQLNPVLFFFSFCDSHSFSSLFDPKLAHNIFFRIGIRTRTKFFFRFWEGVAFVGEGSAANWTLSRGSAAST